MVTSTKKNTSQIKDSSLFNWKLISTGVTAIYNIYVADTNNVFFESGPLLGYYDGDSIKYITETQNHFRVCIDGFNSQNVYFAGFMNVNPPHSALEKWNGSSIENIQFPSYDTNTTLQNILVTGPDNVWIIVLPHYIYHYENSTFTLYDLTIHDLFQPEFFKDQLNNLYLFGSIGISNNTNIFYTFKLNGNSWDNILKDTLVEYTSELTLIKGKCGKDYMRYGLHGVYIFNGNGWSLAAQVPDINMNVFAGENGLKFLSGGNTSTDRNDKLYFYTGSEFLLQSNFVIPLIQYDITSMGEKNGIYYGALLTVNYPNYFFIGKPK